MALSDYRLCDVCDGKAFYDARLNYEIGPNDSAPYRLAGREQYEDAELNAESGVRLDYVGDWAVLCDECAKMFKTKIVPIEGRP